MPITLWWTPSHYGDASADEFSEMQRALDSSKLFKVTLKSAEWATYSKTLGTQYGAFQLGWFPDYPDAEDYITPFYGTKSNFTSNGYSNPKMDAVSRRRRRRSDVRPRLAFIRQAQMIAAQDAPIIPYWQNTMLAAGRSNVHKSRRRSTRLPHAVLAAVEVVVVRAPGAVRTPASSRTGAMNQTGPRSSATRLRGWRSSCRWCSSC